MKRSRWFLAFAGLAGLSGLWAQVADNIALPGGPRHGNMDFIAHEMMSRVVKGVPFAADAVTVTTQSLPNGTHINRTAAASLYRDSEGRTRRDVQSPAGAGAMSASHESGRPAVFIHDPVAQSVYVLDPQQKTARKMTFVAHDLESSAGPNSAAPTDSGVAHRHGQRFGGTVKTESLGTQVIDGLEVEGTRRTVTIPVGAVGNDQPIESVSERWYSPDLQVVVKSIHSDPRFGQTVYQLSNIRRGDQPASLFEVPSDFTIKAASRGPRASQ